MIRHVELFHFRDDLEDIWDAYLPMSLAFHGMIKTFKTLFDLNCQWTMDKNKEWDMMLVVDFPNYAERTNFVKDPKYLEIMEMGKQFVDRHTYSDFVFYDYPKITEEMAEEWSLYR
ncbi:MAG: Dabb family protein [Muribaculaceae bacterium]|nr:Dabb family protein [Muribaculaceae bacterium]